MNHEKFNQIIEQLKETGIVTVIVDMIFAHTDGRPITDNQIETLIEEIKKNKDVTTIELINVNLGRDPELVNKLADAITGKEKLVDLNVGKNEIGDEGAIALAKVVKTTTALKRLEVINNGIGTAGIIALAEATKNHPSLEHLELDENDFASEAGSEKAIEALAEMIRGNEKLCFIGLEDCNFSIKSAMPIINAVRELFKQGFDTLQNIYISHEANEYLMEIKKYSSKVAKPVTTLSEAGGLSTTSPTTSQKRGFTPAAKFVRADGDTRIRRRVIQFLADEPPQKPGETPKHR